MWTPRSFADALRARQVGGVTLLGPEKGPRTWVACPGCGRRVMAAVLVDVSHIPDVAGDWACDGCWSKWTRPGPNQRMSEPEWVAMHGAPRAVVERFRALEVRRAERGWRTARRTGFDLDAVPERARLPDEMRGRDG